MIRAVSGLAMIGLVSLALAACQTMREDDAPAPAPTSEAAPANLTVRLMLAEPGGSVYLSLIDDPAAWQGDEAGRAFTRPADTSPVIIEIGDLSPGTYAIKVFQDTDGNGDLSTNALGIPTEPYAFSNNAAGNFGPPGFDSAAFEVRGGAAIHEIDID